jgi:hypothetical protein
VINFEDDDDSDGADVEEESDVDEVRDDAAPENPAPLLVPAPPVVLPLPVPVAAPGPRAVAAQVVQDLFKAGALFGSGFTPFRTTTKSGKPITDDAKERLWERHRWTDVPKSDDPVVTDRPPLYGLPPQAGLPLRSNDTPGGHFSLRFVSEIIEKIVEYTNQYPEWAGKDPLTVEEFRAVLGGHIALGIDRAPQLAMNWDSSGRYRRPVVADRFARDRYTFILTNFHTHPLMTEEEKATARAKDALWHIREILELMRGAMLSSYTPSGRLVLDENGTPSRAHSGIQVYNPAKPVKRAIKSFVLVDTVTNYILNFIVFCGKTTLSWSEAEAAVAGAAGGAAAIDEGAADLRNIESDDEGEDDAEKVRFSCHVCVLRVLHSMMWL